MELQQIDPLQQKVFCTIAFHYVPSRLSVLTKVLHSLATFMCKRMDIVVVINNESKYLSDYLKLILKGFKSDRLTCNIHFSEPLKHPHHLTWVNHKLHANTFILKEPLYNVFIYLEDDINLTWANFCYWCRFLPELKKHRLIPGFFRVEENQDGQWYFTDQWRSIEDPASLRNLQNCKTLSLSDQIFCNPGNPYQAFWILDRELMQEYIDSPSFDIEKSVNVKSWDVRMRAAMGLSFENIPDGFKSRSVIPLVHDSSRFDWCASVHHIPNKYALGKSKYGKVPVSEYFKDDNNLVETISAYQNALDVSQSSPWVYERLGDLLSQNNQLNEAISIYKKVVSLEPNNYYCYLKLTKACISQTKTNESITYYKKCLTLNPRETAKETKLDTNLANLEKTLAKKTNLRKKNKPGFLKHKIKIWIKNKLSI